MTPISTEHLLSFANNTVVLCWAEGGTWPDIHRTVIDRAASSSSSFSAEVVIDDDDREGGKSITESESPP